MGALITVDIGGTSMRAASYPIRGVKPLKHNKIPTPEKSAYVFDALVNLIHSVWIDGDEISAISIASPGPIDPMSGYIYNAPNIAGWTNFPLGENLRKTFTIPVFFGNDANFAALGEWKYGAGIGHSDLIYMTISTGIGGGIICSDQLILGKNGLAAELGHVIVDPDGPICTCGKKGHLEGFASGPAIVEYTKKEILSGQYSNLKEKFEFSAHDVAIAAVKGDKLAINAYKRAGKYIGLAITSFIHIFNPSMIILGGGVSLSENLLLEPIRSVLKKEIMDSVYVKELKIVPAKLGDDAGLMGAVAFAHTQLGIE